MDNPVAENVWKISHLRNALHELRNTGPLDRSGVSVQLKGAGVIGGNRNWRNTYSEIGAGEAVEFTFQSSWGASEDMPYLHVEYHEVRDGNAVIFRTDVPFPA